jgi:DHA2 family multidrug resistance protein
MKIFLNVCITTILAVVSAVATVIADLSIQGELALSDTQAIWLTTLYLLGVNTTVPTGNWLGNHFGFKRAYAAGVFIFAISSGIASVSYDFYVLGLSRILEGIGAGIIFPVGLALITQSFSKEKAPVAVTLYLGFGFGLGFGLGLPLSGFLTQFHSWRNIFHILLAIGLAAAASCWMARPKVAETAKVPFDYWGFLSFATFISTLLIALTLGPIKSTDEGWLSPIVLGCFFTAAIALIATILIESNHKNPIIPLALFKGPIFSITVLVMFLIGMALFGSISVLSNYMIRGLQYEKYVASKIAMSYGFTQGIVSIIANFMSKVVPLPFLIFSGLFVLIYSYFLNNELSWLTGPDQVIPILMLRGVGIGLTLGPATVLALKSVLPEFKTAAATLLTFFRQVGGTYGGTIIAIFSIRKGIFHFARWSEQTSEQQPGFQTTFIRELGEKAWMTPAEAKIEIVKNIANQAYIQGLNDAMIALGYITLAAAVLLGVALGVEYLLSLKHKERL